MLPLDDGPDDTVLEIHAELWNRPPTDAELDDAVVRGFAFGAEHHPSPCRSEDEVREVLAEAFRFVLAHIGFGPEPPSHGGFQWVEDGVPRLTAALAEELEMIGYAGGDIARRLRYPAGEEEETWHCWPRGWLHLLAAVLRCTPHEQELPIPRPRFTLPRVAHISPFVWLVATAADLRRLGVETSEMEELRKKTIGHARPMSLKWLPAIGLWGRVGSVEQICEATGATSKQVNSFRQKHGLRSAGRDGRRTQARLAFEVEQRRTTMSSAGITPFEWRTYKRRWIVMQLALEGEGTFPPEGFDWSDIEEQAEEKWHELDLTLRPPAELLEA